MFKRQQFGIVFNTLFSLVFGGAMTFFALFARGNLSLASFIVGLVPAYAINFTLGSYIPLLAVGNAFAGIFIKNEDSKIFYLLRMLAIVFIMTAAMSFLVMFSQMGFAPELLPAFVMSFPATFAFAYVVAVCVFPFLLKATMGLCTKE